MRRIQFCLIAIIFYANGIFAQTPPAAVQNLLPKILPASPEAASFTKFGNYQVNLFTGLPDISIPLYEIKVGELSVPVSISYHASGIKVNDFGSWVGLGWNLNAGGAISRKVMGLTDEANDNYLSGNTVKLSADVNPFTTDGLYYLSQVSRMNKDCEPDIFSYNIPGKSGKFIFNQRDSLKPIIMPFEPIKIIRKSYAGVPLLFDIKDERGVLHKFETGEYTDAGGGQQTSGISTWKLTKLFSANGQDSISFNYASRWGAVSYDYSDKIVVNDEPSGTATSDQGYSYGSPLTVYVDELKMQEIKFRNGKMIFEGSDADRQDGFAGQKKLNKIKVYSLDPVAGTYTLVKTIIFYQSYFVSAGDGAIRSLRLDSLAIADNTEAAIEKFRFLYNTQLLPVKTSKARDYWGYYNGKDNDILIPRTEISWQSTSQSTPTTITIGSTITNGREPDPAYMQAGMLQKIYYPTGGRTDFTYETNKYIDNSNNIKYAGGLRIKTITSLDSIAGKTTTKNYTYGDNESGYGRKNFILNNYFFQVQQYTRTLGPVAQCPGCNESEAGKTRTRTFVSNPVIEIEPFDGAPVVYPTVTEYVGDPANALGKTVYTFTDHADGLNTSMAANRPIITSYHMDRGQLSGKREYRRNGDGSYTILHSLANAYQAFPEQFYANVGFVATKTLISNNANASDLLLGPENPLDGCSYNPPGCGNNDSYSFQYANYSIRSTDSRLKQTIDTTFDQQDPAKFVQNTTQYFYDNFNHQQITRIKTTTSTGDSLFVNKKYPHDFSTTSPYGDMISRNIISNLVEEKKLKNSTQLLLQKNNYADWSTNNYLLDSIQIQQASNTIETRAKFVSYDAKGNIQEMKKTSDASQAVIWDYNKTYPIASVTNAGFGSIAYTSFEADGTGNWTIIGTAVNDATSPTGKKCFNITSTNYLSKSSLNTATSYIVSYWSKSGSSNYTVNGGSGTAGLTSNGWTYYEHEVTGASTITLTTSGGGSIDEVRLYPKGSLMTTYSYDPLVGMTSQSDATGHITTYEYDGFSRPILVRDVNKNIIKRFDYLYQAPNNTDAFWQTISGPTCTQSSGQNTGYQVTVQQDKNPNSPTYNQQQTTTVYNTTACPTLANVTYSNSTSVNIYMTMTNTSTSVSYSFTLNPGSSSGTVAGQVPIGTYNVSMSSSNGSALYNYGFYSYSSSGVNTANFYNVSVCATCAAASVSNY